MDTYLSKNIIFCPRCQAKLDQQSNLASCPNCHFTYYLNPAPCTVLLFCKNNQVLLAKRAIEPRQGYWDLPGGFIGLNETAEEGAIREGKEETGLDVKINQYLGSAPDIYGETLVPTLVSVFTVDVLGGEMKAQDDVAELKWFDLDQLPSEFSFPTVSICLDMLKNSLQHK